MDLGRVELLVGTLYDPKATPEEVFQAQQEVQALQRSQLGWQLGVALLNSPHPNAQFLGALSFMVKVTNGEQPSDSFQQLLNQLEVAKQRQYAPFVVRKILGVYAALLLRSPDPWDKAIKNIALILGNGDALCEFLRMVIEDGQADSVRLRARAEPAAPFVLQILDGLRTPQAIDCWAVWANAFFDLMQPLVPQILRDLEDATLFEKACNVVKDIYGSHWREWSIGDRRILTETIANILNVPLEDDNFLSFARLVLEVSLQDFTETRFHRYILQLSGSHEHVTEDELAFEVLEFWSEYVEHLISAGCHADPVIEDVISIYLPRIKIWNMSTSEFNEFNEFRRQFTDFLELAYPLVGVKLFNSLTQTILANISADWIAVECGCYALTGLAEIVGTQTEEYQALLAVFGSPLWDELQKCPLWRPRQTGVQMIGSFVGFFSQPEMRTFLAPTLNYLFNSLRSRPLQNAAARSISQLCESCRTQLSGEWQTFLGIYSQICGSLEETAHFRTVAGITYVIESLPNPEVQDQALNELLGITQTCGASPLTFLKLVAEVAKSFRTPSDMVPPDELAKASNYWVSHTGLRDQVISILQAALASDDPLVTETCCRLIKAGLVETKMSPFVFEDNVVVDFIRAKWENGPESSRPVVVDLAAFLVSTEVSAKQLKPQVVEILFSTFQNITGDCTVKFLELLMHVVTGCPQALESSPYTTDFLQLALLSLGSTDRFVLRAATSFWTSFLSQPLLNAALNVVGPDLTNVLCLQISGLASRSDLDPVTDVIKVMMSKHQRVCSVWFKDHILDNPQQRNIFNLEKPKRAEFLAQLSLVRGSRQTNEVVKRFWLSCRGIPDYL